MEKGKTCFLVWVSGDENDPSDGYYNQYESIENAVKENDEPVEVFEVKPILLGSFYTQVSIKKSKRKKAQ